MGGDISAPINVNDYGRGFIMNAAKIFVMAILIALIPVKTSASGFVADISPAEFSARYTKAVQYMMDSFGSKAAMDYSYFLIKDVFKDREHNGYFAYINEDYDHKQMNAIVMYAQDNAGKAGITGFLILAEANVPDRLNKLYIETVLSLMSIGAKSANIDEVEKIVKRSKGTYKFYDSSLNRNIYLTAEDYAIKIYTD